MSDENKVFTDDEADRRFTESVKKFADAFLALTDDEKEELQAYVGERCEKAEKEYKKHTEQH